MHTGFQIYIPFSTVLKSLQKIPHLFPRGLKIVY